MKSMAVLEAIWGLDFFAIQISKLNLGPKLLKKILFRSKRFKRRRSKPFKSKPLALFSIQNECANQDLQSRIAILILAFEANLPGSSDLFISVIFGLFVPPDSGCNSAFFNGFRWLSSRFSFSLSLIKLIRGFQVETLKVFIAVVVGYPRLEVMLWIVLVFFC